MLQRIKYSKQRFIALSLFLLNFLFITLNAQDNLKVNQSVTEILLSDITSLGEDALTFYTGPFSFSKSGALYTSGVAAGTGLLMYFDDDLRNKIGRQTIKTLNNDFWDIPTRYGIVSYANIAALSTYAAGLIFKKDKVRITGRLLFESLSISGVTVVLARYVFARSRPYSGEGQWKYNWFEWNNEIESFPSGHTTVAFAFSTVLAERIDNNWARLGLYGLASLTAFARVYNNQHWASDVFVGALLGFVTGMHVINKEEQREGNADNLMNRIEFYNRLTQLGIRVRLD
ncbi:MAG: phosphatase PAP2 family protein [Ignavibacteriales bacterium]|nr:MAG: phosphatase PAP2 family protein [Ignavibacteriales bacterium]